jgi:hypothetical protein
MLMVESGVSASGVGAGMSLVLDMGSGLGYASSVGVFDVGQVEGVVQTKVTGFYMVLNDSVIVLSDVGMVLNNYAVILG